jgi:hypothetical protein
MSISIGDRKMRSESKMEDGIRKRYIRMGCGMFDYWYLLGEACA